MKAKSEGNSERTFLPRGEFGRGAQLDEGLSWWDVFERADGPIGAFDLNAQAADRQDDRFR
jgi:hypothetical protein